MWRRSGAGIIAEHFSCENRGKRSWASLTVSAMCDRSASRRSPRTRHASDAAVLWHGAEAAGVAAAMIEAQHGKRMRSQELDMCQWLSPQ